MEYVSLLMVFAVAAGVAGALMGIPLLIAPKRTSPAKQAPFECGKDPVLFVWPWATIYRTLGWFGFVEMMVFLGVLMLGFLYIWKKRGLEWE
ncbi:MAG: NADH-quinone oxidoreductase subunit A [Candidatus Rokubacteria bacterium]|nr:NADH-quinone oxidoreductase subunit A [Candidatus Rokubacteria bacterium]